VHEVLDSLDGPAPPPLPGPLPHLWPVLRWPMAQHLRLLTAGLLPPVLRQRFGLTWTLAHEAAFRAAAASSRAATPLVPRPVRISGPYYVRWRRKALERGDVAAAPPARRPAAVGV
jgi:uncharacterized protein (DUF2236 family)